MLSHLFIILILFVFDWMKSKLSCKSWNTATIRLLSIKLAPNPSVQFSQDCCEDEDTLDVKLILLDEVSVCFCYMTALHSVAPTTNIVRSNKS